MSNQKIVCTIQTRMGSTRLKKKALRKILGKTLIEHIFRRLKEAKEINEIVLATSLNRENDILVKHAKDLGLKYYRGSEEDLVSRLYETGKKFKADAIVRITGDCPLVDPELVDKMIKIYRKKYKKIDFMTNVFPPTFPDGLDIDILPLATLKKLNTELRDSLNREYLTFYIMKNPKKPRTRAKLGAGLVQNRSEASGSGFRIYNFKNSVDLSSFRWTVDYLDDLLLVKEIFKFLYGKNKIFIMADILNFLKKNPQILKININKVDRGISQGIRGGAYHSMANQLNKSKKYE